VLHAAYDAQFGGGRFNALFKFPNISGPKAFNWNWGHNLFVTYPNVFVDQLAVVPEAGVVGMLLGGALGLRMRLRK
jgi:hypothetical protein